MRFGGNYYTKPAVTASVREDGTAGVTIRGGCRANPAAYASVRLSEADLRGLLEMVEQLKKRRGGAAAHEPAAAEGGE